MNSNTVVVYRQHYSKSKQTLLSFILIIKTKMDLVPNFEIYAV